MVTGGHLEEMTPKGLPAPPGMRKGAPCTSSHRFTNKAGVSEHSTVPHACLLGLWRPGRESRRDLETQGVYCANITLSLKQRDQKNQNRMHLHKIQIFELCINRRRFWLAFPKEALISFVKWGNGCATLHQGVYKRCK